MIRFKNIFSSRPLSPKAPLVAQPSRPSRSGRVLRSLLLVCCCVATEFLTAADSNSLCVMTYNLRYASDSGPNKWPDRRPLIIECITSVAPDLIGTQEGLYPQLKDIASDLPAYDWIGLGREGGSRGEFMAIIFLKSRFEPLAFDHFWLSDTPKEIGSSTWGNTNRRMVTWVRFQDRRTGREFYMFNTHFDHLSQSAREKSAQAVREAIANLKPQLPVILTGDFNAVAGANKAYRDLLADDFFRDTWSLAAERINPDLNTFNDFQAPVRQSQRIDWILVRPHAKVGRIEIVPYTRNGRFPSDHFPVACRLSLP